MNDSELEIFCAEKVMGWKTHAVSDRLWYTGSNSIAKARFHPLTSISDAFMLVDRMRELGYRAHVIGDPSSEVSKDAWMCEFWGVRSNSRQFAATAPRAITLAAVAALEGGK